jgi:hypothetical protein
MKATKEYLYLALITFRSTPKELQFHRIAIESRKIKIDTIRLLIGGNARRAGSIKNRVRLERRRYSDSPRE